MKKSNIVLIGIMGCGKTTIAKMLKERLNRQSIDMDIYIEEKYQMSIKEMFAVSEQYFRERETECCLEIAQKENLIISTGGGVITNPCNMEALQQKGWIIYIDRPVDHILQDVDTSSRPLLKDGPEKLYELYHQRHPLYMQFCDYHLINDGTLEEICQKIIDLQK